MKRNLKQMKRIIISVCFTVFVFVQQSISQDLLSVLDSMDNQEQTTYTTATFKSIRLINGYTSETPAEKELIFTISHRFLRINSGIESLYGLDQAKIRFGFDYGINNRLALGIGRSNNIDIVDGYVKYKLFRQSTGEKNFPVTITWLEGIAVRTQEWANQDIDYPASARVNYVHELLISRKFNEKLSLQLMPVVVHRNMVKEREDQNTVPALGFGGRYKITPRFCFNAEYYYLFPGQTAKDYHNALSLGFSLQTGGHVFQIHFSNSRGMTEKEFVPETLGSWQGEDIYFGFNIIRLFNLESRSQQY
jgi:hypothetical protein